MRRLLSTGLVGCDVVGRDGWRKQLSLGKLPVCLIFFLVWL